MPVTLYALHYGTRRNQFYGLYATVPTVQTRDVADERTGKPTTLYESPDKLELNLCVTQFERLTGLILPLGSVGIVRMSARAASPVRTLDNNTEAVMSTHNSTFGPALAEKVKKAKGVRARLTVFADGVIANLRTADSIEDLTQMLDEFESVKATVIADLVGNAKD